MKIFSLMVICSAGTTHTFIYISLYSLIMIILNFMMSINHRQYMQWIDRPKQSKHKESQMIDSWMACC